MSISFLFLLLLFIDKISPQVLIPCPYNGTEYMNKYPCLPKEDCEPVSTLAISNDSSIVGCSSNDYVTEKIETRGKTWKSWMYSGFPNLTCSIDVGDSDSDFVRCRKIRSCNVTDYFNSTLCEGSLYNCLEPKKIGNSVECKIGVLEAFHLDKWAREKQAKFVCHENRLKFMYKMRNRYFKTRETVQALRCKAKFCDEANINAKLADKSCSSSECVPISTDKSSIRCPDGYNLERHEAYAGVWRYFDSNSAPCSGLKITPSGVGEWGAYDKYRCRKQRPCETTRLFDSSLCEVHEKCTEVVLEDINYSCPKGYQLQYIPLSSLKHTWQWANKLTCDSAFPRLLVDTSRYGSDVIGHIRCMKYKLCDLERFFNQTKCDDSIECESPELLYNGGLLICPHHYGLQAEFDEGQWENIIFAMCHKNFFSIVRKNNAESKNPLAFRCVRTRIDRFFDDNDCESEESCEKPFNCNPISCANNHALQIKTNGQWKDMGSNKEAKCDSNVLYFVHNGGKIEEVDENIKMRCIQLKCAQCENPCPTCVEAAFIFTVPPQWDQCSVFKCGPNTQTKVIKTGIEPKYLDSDTVAQCTAEGIEWKVNNEIIPMDSIECEYFCTLESPITTLCYGNNQTCRPITLIDTKPINECPTLYYEPNNKTRRTELDYLKCNRTNGLWVATRTSNSTKIVVQKGSNVYCYHVGECDVSRYLPTCGDEDEECRTYIQTDSKFHCDDSFVFWSREEYSAKWIKMDGVVELECRAGQILANEIPVSYEFQATCRPKSKALQVKGESKLGLYLGVTCMILILIVIIVATVILRVTGNGWIHTIIIEKARGNKKRGSMGSRNNSVSSVASGKTQSINSHNSTTSRKSTKRTQRKVTTKVARPSSSHSSLPGAMSDSVSRKNKPAVKENVIVV